MWLATIIGAHVGHRRSVPRALRYVQILEWVLARASYSSPMQDGQPLSATVT